MTNNFQLDRWCPSCGVPYVLGHAIEHHPDCPASAKNAPLFVTMPASKHAVWCPACGMTTRAGTVGEDHHANCPTLKSEPPFAKFAVDHAGLTAAVQKNLEAAVPPPRIFSPEEIEARVELIKKVRETWKGQPGYCATLDMEIWALSLVARLVRAALVSQEGDAEAAQSVVETFVAEVERNP